MECFCEINIGLVWFEHVHFLLSNFRQLSSLQKKLYSNHENKSQILRTRTT